MPTSTLALTAPEHDARTSRVSLFAFDENAFESASFGFALRRSARLLSNATASSSKIDVGLISRTSPPRQASL